MNEEPNGSPAQPFLIVALGTIMMGVVAFGLSFVLKTPLAPQIKLDANDFLIGVIATLPLVTFLWWFSNTTLENLSAFRNAQIKFFSEIGFEFTPPRIAIMALAAGISEELLFRGVFQTWLDGFFPVAFAILLTNTLFGLLHMRTWLYAVIAGFVGVYLGAIYAFTDNLITPIVVHTLYDAAALEYTRRAIAAMNKD